MFLIQPFHCKILFLLHVVHSFNILKSYLSKKTHLTVSLTFLHLVVHFFDCNRFLPSEQQIKHSELIRAGILILRGNLFERLQISAGYEMLMAILKSHTSIIQTETKDQKEIDTKEKEENCIENIKNIEIKQPLPNGCDATLETIQIRDGALKLKVEI